MTMNYSEYKKDLQRIHESEVYGCAVFHMAAQVTLNPKRKKKWLVLKDLEAQTLERYLSYMKNSGQTVMEPKGWAIKGYAEGAALGVLPWRLSMRLLKNATLPFQEKFLRLKNNATQESDKKFFGYVYAHEKAIESFAQKELSREQNSLKAAESLLSN
jgi:hypothetical protein